MGVLDGKVAIVTGSNRGIGRGIARGFAREGARMALAARDAALLDDAADEFRSLGADVVAIPTDVTDEAAVDALIERTLEQLGPLDVLVNNAGIAEHAPLVDMTLDAWQRTVDVNLTGPFLCARAALRVMAAAGRGRIINVASISSQRVRPGSASYSATKFGLWGLTQVIALEGRDHGVSCSCPLNPTRQHLGGAANRHAATRGRGTHDDGGRTRHRRRHHGRHAGPREHAGSHGAAGGAAPSSAGDSSSAARAGSTRCGAGANVSRETLFVYSAWPWA